MNRIKAGGILAVAALIAAVGIAYTNQAHADNVDYTVNVAPSLNVSVSSNNVVLDLNPNSKTSDSQDITVTVGTNNITGYELNMSTTGNATSLTRDSSVDGVNDSIPTLSAAAGTTAASLSDNTWGYRLNNTGNFIPYVPNTKILDNSAATNEDTATLSFASKINYSKSAGSYKLDLVFTGVANPLVQYMQDMDGSICTTSGPTLVVDKRDNREYYVQRLADGNCWMLQNLRLGQDTTTLALSTEDSDVQAAGFTLNGKLSNGVFTYSTIGGVQYQNNSSQYYCTTDYGCYYNWYTSTAGAGTHTTTSGAVNYSICPKGWTLPTQPQFAALNTAYGSSATALLVSPTSLKENSAGQAPGLLLGGRYNSSGANSVGSYGSYWSRSAYSAQNGYLLVLNTSTVYPADRYVKYGGVALRCLLR